MRIDAHHHLWDLKAVHYPWLMEKGGKRFFGDPAPIQKDYMLEALRQDAQPHGISGSVHIQVGAADGWQEAQWVQSVADANPDWPMIQVVYCDLTAPDLPSQLEQFQTLSSVRGVRQIIGRAPGEDAVTGSNDLLDNPAFLDGLKLLGEHGLSFDLQLLPELMSKTADVLTHAPQTTVALCHAGSPHERTQAGFDDWAKELKALSQQPQICCKLSGLGMFDHAWTIDGLKPFVLECLAQFGAERCMFGSNFPVDSLTSSYADLVQLYETVVPGDAQLTVFSKTAKRFYRF